MYERHEYERRGANQRFLSKIGKALQRGPKSGGQRRGRIRQFTFAKRATNQTKKRPYIS